MQSNEITNKQTEMVNGWIKEMADAGLSHDDMLEVLKLAKLKLGYLKLIKTDPSLNIENL